MNHRDTMQLLKEASKLPKLGEENFRSWKKGMESVFIIGDYWNEIDPLQAPLPSSPGTVPPNPSTEQIKLKHLIQMCCEEPAAELINGILTGRAAWKALLLAYETSNPADLMALKMKIGQMCMTPEENIRSWAGRLTAEISRFGELGGKVNHIDIVPILLRGLTDQYKGPKEAILTRMGEVGDINRHASTCSKQMKPTSISNRTVQPLWRSMGIRRKEERNLKETILLANSQQAILPTST